MLLQLVRPCMSHDLNRWLFAMSKCSVRAGRDPFQDMYDVLHLLLPGFAQTGSFQEGIT